MILRLRHLRHRRTQDEKHRLYWYGLRYHLGKPTQHFTRSRLPTEGHDAELHNGRWIPLPYFYPYPRSFSFRGSHLLTGQGLDVISIPFQIYFIQATTTRVLNHKPTTVQFLVQKPKEYNLLTGFITTKAIDSQGGSLLYT